MTVALRIGAGPYDQFRALFDGRVRIAGVDPTFSSATIATEIFERALKDGELDVAELGMTYYLRTLDLPEPPFVALPVFPARAFRHSAIYVNTSTGIRAPADLAGRTIGEFALYGHDAGVWSKGILADGFGFRPDRCTWVVGALDRPIRPIDYVPHPHPNGVEVRPAPDGTNLGELLDTGQIDALISGNVPRCVLSGSPNVARLFPDYATVERDYHRDTGIFPIAHLVVLRRALVAEHPRLARAVYDAFVASKAVARQQQEIGRVTNFVDVMVPWMNDLVDRNRAADARDWWSYGVAANRTTLDTYLRYHHEQGLSRRRMSVEEIFVPELLDT